MTNQIKVEGGGEIENNQYVLRSNVFRWKLIVASFANTNTDNSNDDEKDDSNDDYNGNDDMPMVSVSLILHSPDNVAGHILNLQLNDCGAAADPCPPSHSLVCPHSQLVMPPE